MFVILFFFVAGGGNIAPPPPPEAHIRTLKITHKWYEKILLRIFGKKAVLAKYIWQRKMCTAQLYFDGTSVNSVFVSDKIINNSDNFRMKCLSDISVILCVL